MQTDFKGIEFAEHTKIVLSVLAKMKIDLDTYKTKENSNILYVEKSQKIINTLLAYITEITPNYITHLGQSNNTKFSEGYNSGFADAENKYTWKPDKNINREDFRLQWNLKQKDLLPHLF